MKSFVLIFIGLMIPYFGISQISGNIKEDGRGFSEKGDFTIKSHASGMVVFQISVNIKGEITSAKVIDSETTVKSTPAKIDARNYLTSNFKFEAGTWYPKYHQGKIMFTLVKE